MTEFNEHSAEVLDKIRELYHQAVVGSISAALLAAIRFGWSLGRTAEAESRDAHEGEER